MAVLKKIILLIRKVVKYLFLDVLIPFFYKRQLKNPVDDNKIVFIELRYAKLSGSFSVIYDELKNNYDYDLSVVYYYLNKTSTLNYILNVIRSVKEVAKAKYIFMYEGSTAVSAMPLRKETKVVQLWHGCGAFKKFGFSTADLIFAPNREEQIRHPFYKHYNLVTVSSPEVVWAYCEALNIPEEKGIIQPTGISRTDLFFDDEYIKNNYNKLYERVPFAKGKKVILYAPTYRGRIATAQSSDKLDVAAFYEALGDEYVLLFKHHPVVKTRPAIQEEYSSFAIDVSDILSIEEVLCVSDICISDYSSLVFEYSLFEKPLIFFAYDLDEYFDWRGFYYDYYELAPGPVTKTNEEIIDYVKHIDERFDKKAIQDFRYKFMRSCDGNSTERILSYIFSNK